MLFMIFWRLCEDIASYDVFGHKKIMQIGQKPLDFLMQKCYTDIC